LPSVYIVLEQQIPNVETYVSGQFLSKHNAELERLAKRVKVKPLMAFYGVSQDELSAMQEELGVDLSKGKTASGDPWFSAEEGLRTVETLLNSAADAKVADAENIQSELREFATILGLAKTKNIRWRLAIAY
jgi:hypothetical protein